MRLLMLYDEKGALGWMNRGGMVGPFQDAGTHAELRIVFVVFV